MISLMCAGIRSQGWGQASGEFCFHWGNTQASWELWFLFSLSSFSFICMAFTSGNSSSEDCCQPHLARPEVTPSDSYMLNHSPSLQTSFVRWVPPDSEPRWQICRHPRKGLDQDHYKKDFSWLGRWPGSHTLSPGHLGQWLWKPQRRKTLKRVCYPWSLSVTRAA